jgi:hypothetical protein
MRCGSVTHLVQGKKYFGNANLVWADYHVFASSEENSLFILVLLNVFVNY